MKWQRRHAVWVLGIALAGCGMSRGRVKSLSDPGATSVQFHHPVVTSIAALNAVRAQCGPMRDRRKPPEEFNTYQVRGVILKIRRERDHDIHIILADPTDLQARMVVEIDDPTFKRNALSPYRAELTAARSAFDMLSSADGRLLDTRPLIGTTVCVTGVGFFDINHLQRGRARSCIELHPVLDIQVPATLR